MTPIGVVLAGGKSTRMGRDKAVCEIDGARLIDRVVARLLPQTSRILISGSHDYGTGLKCVRDERRGAGARCAGPCAGVFSVARRLAGETTGFLTVPVDGPFSPRDLAERLVGSHSAVAGAGGRLHPTFAWWIIADVERAARDLEGAGDVSLRGLAEAANARVVPWADEAPFDNVNTVEDLVAARENARLTAQERI